MQNICLACGIISWAPAVFLMFDNYDNDDGDNDDIKKDADFTGFLKSFIWIIIWGNFSFSAQETQQLCTA